MNLPRRLVRAHCLCLFFCLFLLLGLLQRCVMAQDVLDTIRFGGYGPPLGYSGYAVNSVTNTVYIANRNNAISVIDGAANTVKTTIYLDRPVESLAVNVSTNRVYAIAHDYNSVAVIDGSSNKVLPSFALPALNEPADVAVDASRNRIYVACYDRSGYPRSILYSLDGGTNGGNATNVFKRDAYLPAYPYANTIGDEYFFFDQVKVNPAYGKIYVFGRGYFPFGSNTYTDFYVLDSATYQQTAGGNDIYSRPTNMAIDPATGKVYVGGFLSVFDYTGLPIFDFFPSNVGGYVVGDSSHSRVYTSSADVIDTATDRVIAHNPLYANIRIINPATSVFYAMTDYRNSVIEARRESDGSLLTPIVLGYQPNALATDAVNHRLYVAQTAGLAPNAVAIVDTLTDTTLANVTYSTRPRSEADDTPTAVAVDSGTQMAYVATNSGSVAVIDGRALTATATIDLGVGSYRQLTDIAVDPATHTVYVADGRNVYVVDAATRTLTATLTNPDTSDYPTKLAWNPVTQTLYTLGNFNAGDSGGVSHAIVSLLHKNLAGDYDYTTIPLPDFSNGNALALNTATNTVYITSSHTNYDPATSSLYVLNGATQALTTIDPGQFGIGAAGIAVDAAANILYVTDDVNNRVALVNGSTYATMKTVPVGNNPAAIAVDATTGRAYSLDTDSQQISVIGRSNTPVDVSAQVTATPTAGFRLNAATGKWTRQYRLTNTGAALSGPVSLVLLDLSNAALTNGNGVTQAFLPAGKPYKTLTAGVFGSGSAQSLLVTLEFSKTNAAQAIGLSSFKVIQGSNR